MDAKPEIVEVLRAFPVFQQYRVDELEWVAGHLNWCSADSGALVAEKGTQAEFLDFVVEGRLQVFMPLDDEEVSLVEVAAGDMLGDREFFGEKVHEASVRALEPTRLLRLSYEDLIQMFQKLEGLQSSLLAMKLRETNLRLQESVMSWRRVERSLKHLNRFLDLSDMEELGKGSEGLIKRIVYMASTVMKAERASLFLVDEETGDLWSKVAQGAESRRILVPRGSGLAGWVLEHNSTLVIDDVYSDPRFNPEIDRQTGFRTGTMMCGPIVSPAGRTVGVIQVMNKKGGAFNTEDLPLFKAFSHQSAVAVENFFLFRKLVVTNERLAVMLDVLEAVTQTRDLPSLISRIVEKTIGIMQCERATFFVLDQETRELWSLKAIGEEFKEIRFPSSTGLAGYAACHNEFVHVEEVYKDARFNEEIDRMTGFRTNNIVCAPVHDREGKVIGVVQAINKVKGPFEEDDVELLKAVASQLNEALQKNTLLSELMASHRQLEEYSRKLEEKVEERTLELTQANRHLHRANGQLQTQNEQLEELNRQKSEFLGIAAHDLKNPLASIAGLADILAEETQGIWTAATGRDAENRQMVEDIATSAKHMLRIIDDLMNSGAIEGGQIRLDTRQCDLGQLARDVVRLNRHQAENKGQRIILGVTGNTQASVDPIRTHEIMDNLISNAVKYSPRGCIIRVLVESPAHPEGVVRFSVADEGPGFTDEDKTKLFGRFQTLSARPTGGELSSGLGLSIVKNLVEIQGETISVDSALGEGTTFRVEFPASPAPGLGESETGAA